MKSADEAINKFKEVLALTAENKMDEVVEKMKEIRDLMDTMTDSELDTLITDLNTIASLSGIFGDD